MPANELTAAYLDALEAQDLEKAAGLMTDSPAIDIPFSSSGDTAPWFEFNGKEQALGYVSTIFKNFAQVKLNEHRTHVTEDGKTVFVETKGDLIQRQTGSNYRNVYVFKFTIENGLIAHVSEFTNPVAFAKLMGMPLG